MAREPAVPSPCINVCVMDEPSGWCTGCFRTMDEIVAWSVAANSAKLEVLATLPQREAIFFKTQ